MRALLEVRPKRKEFWCSNSKGQAAALGQPAKSPSELLP